MQPVEYYPLLVKTILSNLVDSTEQYYYSRKAYFCVKITWALGALSTL